MKVYVDPTGLHSRAMVRVAKALAQYAPPEVTITPRPEDADLVVLHLIDMPREHPTRPGQKYAIIQYCFKTTRYPCAEDWFPLWSHSQLVWSYYDLKPAFLKMMARGIPALPTFYHAPLGVDDIFRSDSQPVGWRHPSWWNAPTVVTTGYVAGRPAEAIEEVWTAAESLDLSGVHIGPAKLEGQTRKLPANWVQVEGVSDGDMYQIYDSAEFVSGLRYVEGFELPAAEGLCRGARPILFAQPDQVQWYGGSAFYIPEQLNPMQMTNLIAQFMSASEDYAWPTVDVGEAQAARDMFNWGVIAPKFWRLLLGGKQ